jgi:hypothetical protein
MLYSAFCKQNGCIFYNVIDRCSVLPLVSVIHWDTGVHLLQRRVGRLLSISVCLCWEEVGSKPVLYFHLLWKDKCLEEQKVRLESWEKVDYLDLGQYFWSNYGTMAISLQPNNSNDIIILLPNIIECLCARWCFKQFTCIKHLILSWTLWGKSCLNHVTDGQIEAQSS